VGGKRESKEGKREEKEGAREAKGGRGKRREERGKRAEDSPTKSEQILSLRQLPEPNRLSRTSSLRGAKRRGNPPSSIPVIKKRWIAALRSQ